MPQPIQNDSYFHAAAKPGMSKWLFVTLVASSIVIVMWAIGIGILISSSKTRQPAVAIPSAAAISPIPEESSNLGPTPIQISPSPVPVGWKKYTHSLYSISYPPEWTVRQFGDANTIQLYNPETVKNTLDRTLIGASLAAQFVLIRVTASPTTPTDFVNSIQVACCTGPSPTPGVTKLFQKQSVTLHSTTGVAYTIPSTNFKNWSIVFSVKSNLLELSSSITSIAGRDTENTVLNTLILNPT